MLLKTFWINGRNLYLWGAATWLLAQFFFPVCLYRLESWCLGRRLVEDLRCGIDRRLGKRGEFCVVVLSFILKLLCHTLIYS